jgi:hypothetical protein
MYFTPQEREYERQRDAAIRNKFKHVKLIVGPETSTRKRIAGIEGVTAYEEFSRKLNRDEWVFDTENQDGQIKFELDENSEWTAWVLYSEFNKRFLASHYPQKMWTFADPKIDEEIQELSEEMAKGIQREQPVQSETLVEIQELEKDINSGILSKSEEKRSITKLHTLIAKFQEEISSKDKPKRSRVSIIKGLLNRDTVSPKKKAELERELAELLSKPQEGMVTVT